MRFVGNTGKKAAGRSARAPRVALDCLGCKLNQAEMELLARQLVSVGYEVVSPDEAADIYILNTCTVTHIADRKSRQSLRRARRRNPHARLVAIGCYAGRAPAELERIEGVELVLDNEHKADVVQLLGGPVGGKAARQPVYPAGAGRRTRAFLKVQDGCHNFCAYCIVPLVRSREACVPADSVVAEVAARVAAGYMEVVLTGTEIGGYHDAGTGAELAGLLERILAETGIRRLRLSSLQPQHITGELIGLWRDERLCRHFHLSLQSGSDGMLERMRRRYTTAGYRQAVERIRAALPDAAVTTDVIVGFPGETNEEFRESRVFCEQLGFARIHVFPYSPRPGTAAAKMPEMVDDAVKKERTQEILALAAGGALAFQRSFRGKMLDVLWEKVAGGFWSGLTGNYIKVYARSSEDITNRLLPVRLTDIYRDGVRGELVKPEKGAGLR